MVKILVSACLLGIPTQWDEDCKKIEKLVRLVKSGKAVFICPEQLGGLPTPREAAEIEPGKTAENVLQGKGRVISKSGQDLTKQFVTGAKRVLKFCQEMEIEVAVLKNKSSSCASVKIFDGTFSKTLKKGRGITAELLFQNRIKVYNEENFPASLSKLNP